MSDCKSCTWAQAASNAFQATARASVAFVNGEALKVSDEIYKLRLSICDGCEFKDDLRCKLCGCFVKAKALLTTEVCPKEKWPCL
jgi:hypothetical protein